jgi:hypothetical protein
MSSQTRGDLESQIANLRKTIAAVTNERDRFDLALRVKRLEDQLAELPEQADERLAPLARAVRVVGAEARAALRPQ